MSFTRSKYDNCAFKDNLTLATSTFDYMVNPIFIHKATNNDPCFHNTPYIRQNEPGNLSKDCGFNSIIDVNSELLGLTRKASKCPTQKYLPTEKSYCVNNYTCISNELDAEDTRITNPPSDLRGTGWNRWEWLPQNPQDKAIIPFEHQINNRLIVKDNHRPCVQRPMDDYSVLPSAIQQTPETSNVFEGYVPHNEFIASTQWQSCDIIRKY